MHWAMIVGIFMCAFSFFFRVYERGVHDQTVANQISEIRRRFGVTEKLFMAIGMALIFFGFGKSVLAGVGGALSGTGYFLLSLNPVDRQMKKPATRTQIVAGAAMFCGIVVFFVAITLMVVHDFKKLRNRESESDKPGLDGAMDDAKTAEKYVKRSMDKMTAQIVDSYEKVLRLPGGRQQFIDAQVKMGRKGVPASLMMLKYIRDHQLEKPTVVEAIVASLQQITQIDLKARYPDSAANLDGIINDVEEWDKAQGKGP